MAFGASFQEDAEDTIRPHDAVGNLYDSSTGFIMIAGKSNNIMRFASRRIFATMKTAEKSELPVEHQQNP